MRTSSSDTIVPDCYQWYSSLLYLFLFFISYICFIFIFLFLLFVICFLNFSFNIIDSNLITIRRQIVEPIPMVARYDDIPPPSFALLLSLRHPSPLLLPSPLTLLQFFLTCGAAEWLDDKHVVFGYVVDGMKTVRVVENVSVGPNNKPKIPCVVGECGQL